MKIGKVLAGVASIVLCTTSVVPVSAEVTLNLDAGRRGTKIGDLHYGIFYEEINHAGDGGLYAELVKNRSFEDASTPEAWSRLGSAKWSVIRSGLLNSAQNQALQVTFAKGGDGIANSGYWGMNSRKGDIYTLSFWVKSDEGFNGNITASLVDGDKTTGSVTVPVNVKGDWKRYEATFTAEADAPKAKLNLTSDQAGTLVFDVVSLFPPTFKGRANGCRVDLAEKLEAMRPAFVRFPGGCFVEGTSRNGLSNRFEWKKTIGGIETRPGHENVNWNYRVTDGLGFHELLQLTEDLGAEPLYVVNIGLGHGWSQPYNNIGEFIEEAMDAIEYCNGDATTRWGAVRIANGHPEPFNLRLIEVGNENYQADANQQSDHYAERYRQFYDAIKAKYPEMIVIGNVEAWGTDSPSWRNSNPVDAVDEHYYRNPTWFASNFSKYDNYDRKGPKVYVGEYAVTSDFGTTGTLRAALGEAIFMLGMERNSDICVMNSYAPIFVNENDQCWKPDMIRFNSSESFGTPSYYVQQLMPNNVGKENIRVTEKNNDLSQGTKIGFSTWSTLVEYDNIRVTDLSGKEVYSDDFSSDKGWSLPAGWIITGGVLRQTDVAQQGAVAVGPVDTPDDFILEFDARKTGGNEGFLIAFNYGDEKNFIWWNLGGWGNTNHAIEVCRNGVKTGYDQKGGRLENNRTYHGRIIVEDGRLRCYLDDELVHDISLPKDRKLYVSANINDDEGLLYCKVVNFGQQAEDAVINLTNARFVSGESTVLTSGDSENENTIGNMTNVSPVSGSVKVEDGKAVFNAPANSLTVLKFKVSDIKKSSSEPMDAAELADVRNQLGSVERRVGNLRSYADLPSSVKNAEVEWDVKIKENGAIAVSSSAWSKRLDVTGDKGTAPRQVGTLTATVKNDEGKTGTIEFPVNIAASDDRYGYLYCYMNSTKEITNYALGTKEDKGKVFNHLIGGAEIFDTKTLAGIEGGTRDAYIGRGLKNDQYLMVTTDMCNANSHTWFNSGIDLLRSSDLLHWESTVFDFRKGKSIFSDPDAVTDLYKTDAEYANINRVWAPQFIWDASAFDRKGGYLVYYSVLSSNPGDDHDRIVYSYADKDFKTLTQPRMFYDPGYSVIDADIVLNDYDNLYHLWLKQENAGGSDRGIYQYTSPSLTGGSWKETFHITNEGSELVEGSSTVRRIDEDDSNIYYMRYSGGSAYKVCEADHEGLNVSASSNLEGTGNFQHGSVMTLTETEYRMLESWDKLIAMMERARGLDNPIFAKAIENGEKALNNKTVPSLYTSILAALEDFESANEAYMKEVVEKAIDGDITSLLINPDFNDNNGDGWKGTSFTATAQGVAEHWNKTFDTWQILENMPAGEYTLGCHGFYRFGGKEAYNTHVDGSEELLAELYINSNSAKFMSLYDESTGYTGSPYTFPDNVTQADKAFNTDNNYGDNHVSCTLENAGNLRVGIRKSDAKATDWTCFDNFTLHYKAPVSGIQSLDAGEGRGHVDVYSVTGVLLKSGVNRNEATSGLEKGVYIIGEKKVIVK